MEEVKETIVKGLVEEKETYVNRETGQILTGKVDIAYYKSLQNDEIIDNLLLGDFNSEGNYSIQKDILIELVAIKKVIKESFNNKHILNSIVKEGLPNLRFTLQIDKLDMGKKLATLRYIEISTKSDGNTTETLRTVVARYKDDDDIYFMTKVCKVFNITKVDETAGADASDEEVIGLILRRIAGLKSLRTKRGEKLDYLAKVYVDEILAILKKHPGRFSEYILRMYVTNLKGLEGLVGKTGYYVRLKTMLDEFINSAKQKVNDPEVMKLIDGIRETYIASHKAIHEEIAKPAKVEVKKVEEISKPKDAAKSASGKKAGGKKSAPAIKKAAGKKTVKKQNTPEHLGRPVDKKPEIEVKKPIIEKTEKAIDLIPKTEMHLVSEKELWAEFGRHKNVVVKEEAVVALEKTEVIAKTPVGIKLKEPIVAIVEENTLSL